MQDIPRSVNNYSDIQESVCRQELQGSLNPIVDHFRLDFVSFSPPLFVR
jgi:hypothetical protein